MSSRSEYFDLAESYPEAFANPPGAGFELLLDEGDIQQAEGIVVKFRGCQRDLKASLAREPPVDIVNRLLVIL